MLKRTLSVLRSAAAYYMEQRDGTHRSVATTKLPMTRAQPDGHLREELDDEQLAAFYAVVDREEEPYRTMLLLLPRTGLRIGEMCSLTPERYDRGARELRITGKRGRTRRVPLSSTARNILNRYLDQLKPGEPWLFWTPTGRQVKPRDVRRVTFRLASENEEKLYALCPHRCRHTTATQLLDRGVNIKLIQDILGHRSVRSLDPYLHTKSRQRRAALKSLELPPGGESLAGSPNRKTTRRRRHRARRDASYVLLPTNETS